MPSYAPPPDYDRVRVVANFQEILTTPFADGVNALCWPRELPGDFGEIVRQLGPGEGIMPLDEARLRSLTLSPDAVIARDILIEDHRRLRIHGLLPELNCIYGYPRDEDSEAVPTDVFSFHADSAPVPADTWLCSYQEAASEGLRNDEAVRRIDDPLTRAQLRQEYGGPDDASFVEFLHEHSYDLHYAPLPQARPFSFGRGHLWRIALEYPGSPVPPCLHRAPLTTPGDSPRLLLIS